MPTIWAGRASEAAAMNADSIQYALETDWPVGAAGFGPQHIESEFAKTLSPKGRTRTCASRNKDGRAALLTNLSGAQSTPPTSR